MKPGQIVQVTGECHPYRGTVGRVAVVRKTFSGYVIDLDIGDGILTIRPDQGTVVGPVDDDESRRKTIRELRKIQHESWSKR